MPWMIPSFIFRTSQTCKPRARISVIGHDGPTSFRRHVLEAFFSPGAVPDVESGTRRKPRPRYPALSLEAVKKRGLQVVSRHFPQA